MLTKEQSGSISTAYSQYVAELSSERTLGYAEDIVRIGNRWLGSSGEARAREYILGKFREFGIDVHTEDFEYVNYAPKLSKLEIVSPVQRVLDCVPLEYSNNGEVEGELVYLGQGTEQEFQQIDNLGFELDQKIVVTSSFAPFLVSPFCEQRKAAGMIVVSNAPDNYIRNLTGRLDPNAVNPTLPYDRYLTSFPGVVTSLEGGERLLTLMSASPSTRARVSHEAQYTKKTTSNIVAVVKGEAESNRQIILGAHYDSQLVGELAVDNGIGVASLLEMARVTARSSPRRTLTFLALSGAEIGMLGAADYVRRRKNLSRDAVAMLTIDALSSKFPAQNNLWATKDIQELALSKAKEAGWKVDSVVDPARLPFGDYYPFSEIGIPSTWIWEYPPKFHPYYHTAGDVLEHIEPKKLMKVLEVNARLAFHLAYGSI